MSLIIRNDSQSAILRDPENSERFILQCWDPPHLYLPGDKPKSIPAAGSLPAVIAAARLLLNATDEEITAILKIHSTI